MRSLGNRANQFDATRLWKIDVHAMGLHKPAVRRYPFGDHCQAVSFLTFDISFRVSFHFEIKKENEQNVTGFCIDELQDQ